MEKNTFSALFAFSNLIQMLMSSFVKFWDVDWNIKIYFGYSYFRDMYFLWTFIGNAKTNCFEISLYFCFLILIDTTKLGLIKDSDFKIIMIDSFLQKKNQSSKDKCFQMFCAHQKASDVNNQHKYCSYFNILLAVVFQ